VSVSNLTPSVLDTGHMSDSPLEVGIGISLDKGVDGSDLAWLVVGGGVSWIGLFVGVDWHGRKSVTTKRLGNELLTLVGLAEDADHTALNGHAKGGQDQTEKHFSVHDDVCVCVRDTE